MKEFRLTRPLVIPIVAFVVLLALAGTYALVVGGPRRAFATAETSDEPVFHTGEAWAVVSATGALVRSSGGGSVLGCRRNALGQYQCIFGQNINRCVYQATVRGSIPGMIAVSEHPVDRRGTSVRTFGPTGAASDRGFMVSVNCVF
ncbi:MAG TPA: hypothetical protein VGW35_26120 [Methylomirabilota bacterium]|nr:hypothetical protein [Methylomirabilota bacterium]